MRNAAGNPRLVIARLMVARVFVLAAAMVLMPLQARGQDMPAVHYNSSFLAESVWPNGVSGVDWFPDDHEAQGVTNDGENWYFTLTSQDWSGLEGAGPGFLVRIPKGVPLAGDVFSYPGVLRTSSEDWPIDPVMWHWGDPDHFRFNDVDYIVVPISSQETGDGHSLPTIALFRADDLVYVNFAFLDDRVSAGWCAVGVDSMLYTSPNDVGEIIRFRVDWERFINNTGVNDAIDLNSYEPIALVESDGSTPLDVTNMQGGEFTADGEMLYLVSGRGKCILGGAEWSPRDGIHAIETHGWREVRRSTKTSDPSVPFRYDYDPTCQDCYFVLGGASDTPEGVTVWDLEDGSLPYGVFGTVHVLVDRYAISGICDDKLYLHHLSHVVLVDGWLPAGVGYGTRSSAFRTIREALEYYPIWDGATILITPRSYNERLRITERVRLEVAGHGFSAVIGRP